MELLSVVNLMPLQCHIYHRYAEDCQIGGIIEQMDMMLFLTSFFLLEQEGFLDD